MTLPSPKSSAGSATDCGYRHQKNIITSARFPFSIWESSHLSRCQRLTLCVWENHLLLCRSSAVWQVLLGRRETLVLPGSQVILARLVPLVPLVLLASKEHVDVEDQQAKDLEGRLGRLDHQDIEDSSEWWGTSVYQVIDHCHYCYHHHHHHHQHRHSDVNRHWTQDARTKPSRKRTRTGTWLIRTKSLSQALKVWSRLGRFECACGRVYQNFVWNVKCEIRHFWSENVSHKYRFRNGGWVSAARRKRWSLKQLPRQWRIKWESILVQCLPW